MAAGCASSEALSSSNNTDTLRHRSGELDFPGVLHYDTTKYDHGIEVTFIAGRVHTLVFQHHVYSVPKVALNVSITSSTDLLGGSTDVNVGFGKAFAL